MGINYLPPRILLDLGFVKLYWWGFFVALAFLIALFLIAREFKKNNINVKHAYVIGLLSLISIIVGSRLLYVLYNLSYFVSNPLEIFLIAQGGMISYGGIALTLILLFIYFKKNKLSFGKILNLMAPYVVLGFAIGRIGCFLNGCCYGYPTNLPWAMTFPMSGDGLFRHPTQLYLLLSNLVIFGVLMYVKKLRTKRKLKGKTLLKSGSLFLLFLVLYSIMRFGMDFLKVNFEFVNIFSFVFTLGQIINITIFIISVVLLIILNIKKRVGENEININNNNIN